MTTPEHEDEHGHEPCEDRADPSSWDDPDIADAWQEPADIPPAPDGAGGDT